MPAAAAVQHANVMLHSMFENIQMDLSDGKISDASNFFPYSLFFETIFSYTKSVQDTRLDIECWRKDTVGHFDDVLVVDVRNVGHITKAAKFAQSITVGLEGKPHLDLFHQDKNVLPGCSLFVQLILEETKLYLNKGKE